MTLQSKGCDGTLVSLDQVESVVHIEDELWCGWLCMCMSVCVVDDGAHRNDDVERCYRTVVREQ